MSVTFYVPAAPRTQRMIPCTYGQGEQWACRPGERCGYCANGWEEVWESPAPEINVNNQTAAILLEILELPREPHGVIPPAHVARVRRRIIRALSTDLAAPFAIRPTAGGGRGTGRARFFSGGIDVAQIRERLTRLNAVLAYAQQHRMEVTWS